MFIARHRASDQDFTRDRKLTFERLVTLLLNQLKCALQNELDHFFQILGVAEFGQRFVTAAALSKARKKLKASAFIELNEKSLDIFQKQFPSQKKWFGFRLLAVDGSKVELPDEADVRAHFGTESHHRPMGLLSTLYDLNHRLWLDANLTPLAKGERANAVDHLAHTQEGDLLLYDRGYPAFWLLALHHSLNRHFCMRLPFNFHEEASDFFLSEETEKTVDLKPGKHAEALCREHDLPTDALRLRLIRVPLESDEQEILVTSLLDRERYPAHIFKDLYHRRWGQEEGYKHLKVHAELQNWTGRGLHAVLQDLHSKVLTLNLAAMNMMAAQERVERKTENRKYLYQVNRAQALSKMKDRLVHILHAVIPDFLISRLTTAMANDATPVRPGRKFPRKQRPGVGIRYRPAYKKGR